MIDPRKAASSSSTCNTGSSTPRRRYAWREPQPPCPPARERSTERASWECPCSTPSASTLPTARMWKPRGIAAGWKAASPCCAPGASPRTLDEYEPLAPQPGDRVIAKPRFSAFFATQLDLVLRRLGVGTVVLIGTTTPNCIRTTCYDALSLDYNVVLLEDCTSSRTPEVQAANIEDMAFIGAHIMTCDEFCERGLANVADVAGGVREACFEEAAR